MTTKILAKKDPAYQLIVSARNGEGTSRDQYMNRLAAGLILKDRATVAAMRGAAHASKSFGRMADTQASRGFSLMQEHMRELFQKIRVDLDV